MVLEGVAVVAGVAEVISVGFAEGVNRLAFIFGLVEVEGGVTLLAGVQVVVHCFAVAVSVP